MSNYHIEAPNSQLRRAQWLKQKLESSKAAKIALFTLTILGTSMVIGDGTLTPAISDVQNCTLTSSREVMFPKKRIISAGHENEAYGYRAAFYVEEGPCAEDSDPRWRATCNANGGSREPKIHLADA